jgi:cellulose synthase/poly-beta-1,6-N-acetylglucosamine synthase-like glycosyltransferase
MLIVFWICFAIVGYVYVGYPLLLLMGFGQRLKIRRSNIEPLLSVLIPAHNEELGIDAKIRNLLASDYSREKMEVLIGSDGSSDRTEEIVRKFEGQGVGLISCPQQMGKSAVQNRLASIASGSIFVLTDADSRLKANALRMLVGNFGDPRVGLATSHPSYTNHSETSLASNESLYFRYEGWLRRKESQRGLLAMASGPLFAIRRSLWHPLDPNLGDDFVLPLHVASSGFRNVLEPQAKVAMSLAQSEAGSLLGMKTRIVSKDLRGLLANSTLLNPFRFGFLALSLWSHKLLRWLVPFFLIAMFLSNIVLTSTPLFGRFLVLQMSFYVSAIVGLILRGRRVAPWFAVPFSFCVVNAGALLGVLKLIAGKPSGRWKPARKPSPAA